MVGSYRAFPEFGALWLSGAVAAGTEAAVIGGKLCIQSDRSVQILTGGLGEVPVLVHIDLHVSMPSVGMDGYDAVVEISIMPGRLTTYDEVVRDGAPVRLVGAEREDESLLDLVSGDETVTRARFHLRAGVQIEGADSAMVEEVLVQAWPEESARSWSVIKLAPGDTEYESKQYGSWATARTEPEAMANEGIIQLEPPSVMDERTRVRSLEENLRRRGRPS